MLIGITLAFLSVSLHVKLLIDLLMLSYENSNNTNPEVMAGRAVEYTCLAEVKDAPQWTLRSSLWPLYVDSSSSTF